jgi:hypothetical protein
MISAEAIEMIPFPDFDRQFVESYKPGLRYCHMETLVDLAKNAGSFEMLRQGVQYAEETDDMECYEERVAFTEVCKDIHRALTGTAAMT